MEHAIYDYYRERNNAEMIINRERALHALIVPPPAR
jgi:hypothetical protein